MSEVKEHIENQSVFQPRRKARTIDSVTDKDRRAFLRLAVAQGVAAPAALVAMQCPAAAEIQTEGVAAKAAPRKGAMRHTAAGRTHLHASGAVVRDFADPQLELLRLLREAAEIEHGLMLQYLYCAFSLRKSYAGLTGTDTPTADSILGVAVQEMLHLGAVNKLLVALGSCPHLDRQDFPYEPDIYPFVFKLEPMSRNSLAKYVYCEAPAAMFDPAAKRSQADEAFRKRVVAEFDRRERPNHVGSLYRCVLDMLEEVSRAPDAPITPEAAAEWREKLLGIMKQGEHDHFEFFRSAFEAKHKAFEGSGVEDAWDLRPNDPRYPSHELSINPTAYIGHPNQIQSAPALVLAWLGNLHYWIALSTLDYSYRSGDHKTTKLAMEQMTSALWPIAAELPQHGSGMPFDPLSMGYALGSNPKHTKRIIANFGREALTFASTIEHRLPQAYDRSVTKELVAYMSS